jgi:hypothetical protein
MSRHKYARRLLAVLLLVGAAAFGGPAVAAADGPVVRPLGVGGPEGPNAGPERSQPPGDPPTVVRSETYVIHQIQLSSRTVQEALDRAMTAALDPVQRENEELGRSLDAALARTRFLGLIDAGRVEAVARSVGPLAAPLALVVFLLRLVRYHWERLAGADDSLVGVVADWVAAALFALLAGPLIVIVVQVAGWLGARVEAIPIADLSAAALLPRPAAGGPPAFLAGLVLAVVVPLVLALAQAFLLLGVVVFGIFYLLALLGPICGVLSALPELRWARAWWLKALFIVGFVTVFLAFFRAMLSAALTSLGHADLGGSVAQGATAGLGLLMSLGFLGGLTELGVAEGARFLGRTFSGVTAAVRAGAGGYREAYEAAAAGGAFGGPSLAQALGLGAAAGLRAGLGPGPRPAPPRRPAKPAPPLATDASAAQEARLLQAALAAADGSPAERAAARALMRHLDGPAGAGLVEALRAEGLLVPDPVTGVAAPEERARALRGLMGVASALGAGGAPEYAHLLRPEAAKAAAELARGANLSADQVRARLGLPPAKELAGAAARELARQVPVKDGEGRFIRDFLEHPAAGPAFVTALREAGLEPTAEPRLVWALRQVAVVPAAEELVAFYRDPAGAAALVRDALAGEAGLGLHDRVDAWLRGLGIRREVGL